MSTNQPTLFGAYPWADGSASSPTLFGSGYIPQTFSVTLTETVTGSEAELFSTIKRLAETVTLTEAQVKTITRLLADSATPSDALVKTVSKMFADASTVTDANAVVMTIKTLSDFLVLKEWISIRLDKSITWINPATNANIFDTLWGKYKFGSVVFGGLKPLASWTTGTRRQENWTNENGHKYNI